MRAWHCDTLSIAAYTYGVGYIGAEEWNVVEAVAMWGVRSVCLYTPHMCTAIDETDPQCTSSSRSYHAVDPCWGCVQTVLFPHTL